MQVIPPIFIGDGTRARFVALPVSAHFLYIGTFWCDVAATGLDEICAELSMGIPHYVRHILIIHRTKFKSDETNTQSHRPEHAGNYFCFICNACKRMHAIQNRN